jgi:hypothetical protein
MDACERFAVTFATLVMVAGVDPHWTSEFPEVLIGMD